jgi:hypothetical protein
MAEQPKRPVLTDCSIFQNKHQFISDSPGITQGGLDWLLFHKKKELLEKGVIVQFGRKILINNPGMKDFLLSGGAKVIGGQNHDL